MKKITSDFAPVAVGPYSHGYQSHGLLFTSGQLPISPEDGSIPESFLQQVHQVFQNLKAVVEAGNSSLDHVIKTTCFLQDMNDFPVFNEIYATYFPQKPARTCVAVKTLPKNVLLEVEAIAEILEV